MARFSITYTLITPVLCTDPERSKNPTKNEWKGGKSFSIQAYMVADNQEEAEDAIRGRNGQMPISIRVNTIGEFEKGSITIPWHNIAGIYICEVEDCDDSESE